MLATPRRLAPWLLAAALAPGVVGAALPPPPAPGARADSPARKVDFNAQVRPILSENCFACHGPDARARKARLRLDTKEGAFGRGRSGLPAIVPGKPAASELVARIAAHEEAERMPPVKSGKKLTASQVAILRQWVEQGAPWSEHWAFAAPKRPAVPRVKSAAWARNPIDHFVLARLGRAGVRPSPEADRATLIRRLSLDLTGLPPSPEEVQAFLADRSPDAYERVVDRLLASPRYGERMAMAWLDGARYADSNGYQADFERYMWRWREWVIDAYNANLPFDRFTTEQLAGDLLPAATVEQKIATGFNRNHRINTEGGIIAEEWRVETVADRLETTASVWLGLTVGCARCHDHKYDPITQKEYYRLFSFFNNVPESGIGAEQPINHPPVLKAPRRGHLARLAALGAAVAAAERAVKEEGPQLDALQVAWEKRVLALRPGPTWAPLRPAAARSTGGANLKAEPDGLVVASGPAPGREAYVLTAKLPLKRLSAVRLEALPDDRLVARGPGRSVNGNFVLTRVAVEVGGKQVKLARASADFSQLNYPVASALGGPGPGWAIHPRVGQAHTAVFALDRPLAAGEITVRLEFHSQFDRHSIGRLRLAVTDADDPLDRGAIPADVLAVVKLPAAKRTPAQKAALREHFRSKHAGPVSEAQRALQAARKARADFEARVPTVMVMAELPAPRDAFVLVRGQYDKRGEKVKAGLPAVLPPLPEGAPLNRLGLARWLVSPEHPLTARVAANRVWEQLFGAGLVRSTENFGAQGEPPTHPELLDWLATELVASGWSIKALQRTIVLSATYRQSSRLTPALRERDPDNRLLARQSRYRLQAESVRDNALAVGGLLVERLGGPSVRPYQPKGVWDETNVYGNLRNYAHDRGDGLHRRSLYTIWKRTAAPPTMLLFDSPSREVCAVKRPRTNTPLQALALLNEVTFVEAARALAERMMLEGGPTAEGRVAAAFRRAVAREPSAAEVRVLAAGLARRLARFRADPESAKKLLNVGDYRPDARLDLAELAACTLTASVVLNLDETITRE